MDVNVFFIVKLYDYNSLGKFAALLLCIFIGSVEICKCNWLIQILNEIIIFVKIFSKINLITVTTFDHHILYVGLYHKTIYF